MFIQAVIALTPRLRMLFPQLLPEVLPHQRVRVQRVGIVRLGQKSGPAQFGEGLPPLYVSLRLRRQPMPIPTRESTPQMAKVEGSGMALTVTFQLS